MGLSQLRAFHFLHPAWLLAVPLVWAFVVWFETRRKREGGWSRVIDARLLPLLRLGEGRRGRSPWPLVGAIWTLGALALAGPAWQHQRTQTFRVPAAWMLVLDLSPSMDAADVAPSRVTRARYAIEDILAAAHDARVGLIVFGDEPHTVAPLTTDVETIRALLQPLAPELMPAPGDALAPALDAAGRLLHAAASPHGRVVVLSDGFSDPAAALTAAARLRKQGNTVSVVGVGTAQGAPEPDGSGGFVHDAKGRSVLTRLESDRLRRVAGAGGGRYVSVSALPGLVASLQAESSPAVTGQAKATDTQVAQWHDGGVWLLPPLLVLAALLARRGWL